MLKIITTVCLFTSSRDINKAKIGTECQTCSGFNNLMSLQLKYSASGIDLLMNWDDTDVKLVYIAISMKKLVQG